MGSGLQSEATWGLAYSRPSRRRLSVADPEEDTKRMARVKSVVLIAVLGEEERYSMTP